MTEDSMQLLWSNCNEELQHLTKFLFKATWFSWSKSLSWEWALFSWAKILTICFLLFLLCEITCFLGEHTSFWRVSLENSWLAHMQTSEPKQTFTTVRPCRCDTSCTCRSPSNGDIKSFWKSFPSFFPYVNLIYLKYCSCILLTALEYFIASVSDTK